MTEKTLVLGGPGTGKTTELIAIMERAMERGVAPHQVAFVSFTNAAADEARDRAMKRFGLVEDELPYFRTLHSLAFREMGVSKNDVVGREHLNELAELTGELTDGSAEEGVAAAGASAHPLITVDGIARMTRKSLREAWETNEDVGGDLDWHRFKRFSQAYAHFRRDRGLVDFTDMLERYVDEGWGPVPVKVAIVDEAQDLTLLQWAVVERAFASADQLYVAGDDDQCQPAGTMVTTSNGPKCISELDPATDRLVAFNRRDGELRYSATFEKASRVYNGTLYTVSADGKTTACTSNHKWLVKWADEVKRSKLTCVYLMRKGDDFRVGWCQLFREDGCFHLNVRANKERADAVWILTVCKDKKEAYCYEQIVSAKYGIPLTPFHPTGRHVNAHAIASIFGAVDSRTGALRALKDHRRMVEHPFIDRRKENYSRYGATILEVVACNLLDGLMTVPSYAAKRFEWKTLRVGSSRITGLRVYSLKVHKHETYVADGLITHNSIHEWAGAAQDYLLNLPYPRRVLPLSHRLPAEVFDLSQEIAGRIGRRFPKNTRHSGRKGLVEWLGSPEEVDLSSGKWLLLARTRAQLAELAEEARRQGAVYSVKGAPSVASSHVLAIRAYETLRRGARVDGADAAAALRAMGLPTSKVVEEKSYTADELGVDVKPIWHDALVRIDLDDREYYLSCLRRGEKLGESPRVRVDTIHGSKGAEAENVLLVTDMSYRVKRGYDANPDGENRVWFVGVSRASERLFLVQPRTVYGYPI